MKLRLLCRWPCLALSLTVCIAFFSSFVAAQSAPPSASSRSPSVSLANPYDRELADIQASFPTAAAPKAAVLLQRAYKLRDYLDDRPSLEQWLASVAANQALHPLVGDEALYLMALIDRHHDRPALVEAKLRQLGFVRRWAIVGPFPAADIEAQAGPEQGFDSHRAYSSTGGSHHWRALPEIGPNSAIELENFFSLSGSIAAFTATSIYSEVPRQVAVRFSSTSAAVVWINGTTVFKNGAAGRFGFDQHVVVAQLGAGWNRVLVKFFRDDSQRDWRFSLRFTGLRGGGLVLPVDPQRAWDEPASVSPGRMPAPDDLVSMAEAGARSHPQSAEALEILARIELAHGTGTPAAHREAAAHLSPSTPRFYQLAQMQTGHAAKFQSLNAALAADPNFAPARKALADYYIARRQLEKAASLLRAVVSASPSDFVARTRLADVYAAAGLKSRAASQYDQIAREFPNPLWVKREIARRWESFGLLDRAQALLNSALPENADGADEQALSIKFAEHRRDTTSLRAAYELARRLSPTDTTNLANLAALESGSGNFSAAKAILSSALAIDPDGTDLHQRMAELLATTGDSRGFRQELARAFEIDPQLENVGRRLELADGKPAADPEAAYLARADKLAAEAHHQPPADSLVLADIRVQRVYNNGLSETRVQQVTYLGNDQAVREHRTQSIEYTPNSQQLRILRARVYRRDGRMLEAESGGEKPVSEPGAAMYYDVRSRLLRFPDLGKGDVVEVDYRITPTARQNPYGAYFGELVVFQSAVAERLKRYVLITPAGREFNIHAERMPSPATLTVEGGERIYRWDLRNLAALNTEPRGPAVTELAPYVHVSTFHSWPEMGRWYAQLLRPQLELDSALRRALPALLVNAATEEQKIRAIHQLVVRNTHYVALEFGIYSYRPYPVSETYARRFGDCKDKASLMVALLRAAGIDADLALVRTRRLGDIYGQPASVAIFNHAIVYVPRYDLWLDGTAEYAGLHELPLDDQGALALTVGLDGSAELRRIPVTKADENYTRRTVDARIGSDGVIHFSGSTYTRGEDAPGLRREFEVAQRQRQSFRDRLAEVFPSVRVEEVKVDGATDLDRDVHVDFRGELTNFAGRSSLSLASSWMLRSYLDTLAPLSARAEDLVLSAPWTTEEELRFTLPAGARIAAIPPDSSINTPFGSAELHYQRHGNEIDVRTRMQFRQTRISPQQYAAFRDFCAQVERAFRQEIKVVLER